MLNKIINSAGDFLVKNNWFTVRLIKYKNSSVRIVYYHMVSNFERPHYFDHKAISKKLFQEQIDFFKQHYKIVCISEAIYLIDNNENIKNLLVISFDDGFKENFTNIYPILKRNKISGTFFIISNCIDNKDLMWRNKLLLINREKRSLILKSTKKLVEEYKLSEFKDNDNLFSWSLNNWQMDLKEYYVNFLWEKVMPFSIEEYLNINKPYMNSDEIKQLSLEGHNIGSHSKTHPVFSKLSYQNFRDEISLSCEFINKITNKNVTTFSYPFGRASSRDFENNYNLETDSNLLFFGTKNNLKNTSLNIRWERDNTEHSFNIMLLRFALLPVFRNIKIN
jgi:peptidoglycan/xylan/chitin deacetylase (PgdA/CDA1 family)